MIVGIGVDAVEIDRFRRSLERTPSMKTRLFTHEELEYVEPHDDPTASLAARFAAREAVMKAMGVGLGAFEFHDVWVQRADSGRPTLAVTGRAEQIKRSWCDRLASLDHAYRYHGYCLCDCCPITAIDQPVRHTI